MSLSRRHRYPETTENESLNLGQILMHKLNHHGAFADARSDTLYRAMTHVAHRENSRHASFQETRVAIQGPRRGPLSVTQQVRAGEHKTAIVSFNQVAEPFGTRLRTDKNEQAAGRNFLRLRRGASTYGDGFETSVTMDLDHIGLQPYIDVGRLFNLLDQIVRHGAGQRLAAH